MNNARPISRAPVEEVCLNVFVLKYCNNELLCASVHIYGGSVHIYGGSAHIYGGSAHIYGGSAHIYGGSAHIRGGGE